MCSRNFVSNLALFLALQDVCILRDVLQPVRLLTWVFCDSIQQYIFARPARDDMVDLPYSQIYGNSVDFFFRFLNLTSIYLKIDYSEKVLKIIKI